MVKANKSKNKKTIKLVVKTNNNKKNKNRNKNKKNLTVVYNNKMDTKMSTYLTALTNPFMRSAAGARIPDPFSTEAAVAAKSQGRVIITSNQDGEVNFVFIGRPKQALFSPTPDTKTNNISSASGVTAYTANPKWFYSETSASLALKYDEIRTVVNAIRLHGLQAMGAGIGEFWVARVPMTRNIYGPNVLEAAAVSDSYSLQQICGMPTDSAGYVPISIEAIPGAQRYDVSEMFGRNLICVNRAYSGDHTRWQACTNQLNFDATHRYAQSVEYVTTGGTIVNGDSADDTDPNGWSCILFRGTGFPASTKVFSMDILSHYEVVPVYSTANSGSSTVIQSGHAPPVWSEASIAQAKNMMQKVNFATLYDVVKRGAAIYNDYSSGGMIGVAKNLRGQYKQDASTYRTIAGY